MSVRDQTKIMAMTVSLQTLQALFIGSFISGDLVDGVDICIPFNVLHIF